jgi:hypothetical protein
MDRDALMRVWLMPPEAAERIDAEFRRARAIDVRVRIVAVEFATDTRASDG